MAAAPLPKPDTRPPNLEREILNAITQLEERGLAHASKWLCQFLQSLPASDAIDFEEPELDFSAEQSRYLLAKSHFDLKEYKRASHALRSCQSPKSRFLRLYSQFLAGEKSKRQKIITEQKRPHEHVENLELPAIRDELEPAFFQNSLDAFEYYLLGIVRFKGMDQTLTADPLIAPARLHKVQLEIGVKFYTAADCFVKSLSIFPWNWSVWLDLTETIHSRSVLEEMIERLPPSICKNFFLPLVLARLGLHEEALLALRQLKTTYPNFSWIITMEALSLGHMGQIELFLKNFIALRKVDPHGLDKMDQMATFLKDAGKLDEVCKLAMEATATSKWSLETPTIVARFHQMQGAREMAEKMFMNAIELHPTSVKAWLALADAMDNSVARLDKFRMAEALEPLNMDVKAEIGTQYVQWSFVYSLFYLISASKVHGLANHPAVWRKLIAILKRMKKTRLVAELNEHLENQDTEKALETLKRNFDQSGTKQRQEKQNKPEHAIRAPAPSTPARPNLDQSQQTPARVDQSRQVIRDRSPPPNPSTRVAQLPNMIWADAEEASIEDPDIQEDEGFVPASEEEAMDMEEDD